MTISQVFVRYEHPDRLLSDRMWLDNGIRAEILCDLWQAIKDSMAHEYQQGYQQQVDYDYDDPDNWFEG